MRAAKLDQQTVQLGKRRNCMKQLRRILMVEDDLDIQSVARMSLEAVGGYIVETCTSGREALDRIASFGPDLILLDVMMPEMDGPAVLRALQADASTSALPVVFMTAKAQAHEVLAYREMGAIEVISKPFDPMELSLEIARIWTGYVSSVNTVGGAASCL